MQQNRQLKSTGTELVLLYRSVFSNVLRTWRRWIISATVGFGLLGCVTISWDVPSKHVPVAKKNCRACHDSTGKKVPLLKPNQVMALPRKRPDESREEYAAKQRLMSLSRYNAEEVCFQCHEKLDPYAREIAPAWEHGPFAMGACLVCHNPHESNNPSLLLKYPVYDLCVQCHIKIHPGEKIDKIQGRVRRKFCEQCHDPHYLMPGSKKFPVARPKKSEKKK
jgi:predicted CXXCH cytochrome family protein